MEILRAHAKLLLSLLGSAILALIVALVLAAISVSGVTSMTAADVFLWIALVIFACAVGATAIITCPSLTGGKSALLVLLLVLLIGAGLVGRNGIALWLNKRKAEQIALETPARPIVAVTSTSAPLPTNVSKPVPEKTQAEPAPKVAIRPKPTPKEVAPLANPPAEQTPHQR
jgi:hypothetical protein